MALKTAKRINDNVYGSINITEQELKIIDTPIFQRLRQIKQLGATDFVYPGATHTRLSHSIGTMHMISQFMSRMRRGGGGIVDHEDEQKLRLAALLHDIGHYPYSHTGENVAIKLNGMRHEKFGEHLVKRFFAEHLDNYSPSEITDIFTAKDKSTASLLISSALDADKADYLMRDSYHAGVPYGRVSLPRLIRTISYVKDGIAFEKDEVAVEDFLIGRYHMYRAVYYHKAVVSFNLMVERIFELLIKEGHMPHPDDLLKSDDEFEIASYTDNLLYSKMYSYLKEGNDRFLKTLIKLFLSREPLECVYLKPTPIKRGDTPKAFNSIKELGKDSKKLSSLAKSAGIGEEDIFPVNLRTLSLIDEETKIYMKNKGKLRPITESSGLILNMIGSSTLYDARVYAMPGNSKRILKALRDYLNRN